MKLATNKDDVFARVKISSLDLITDLAERSCAKLPHWHLDAGQVRLFLVAKAGEQKPLPSAIEAAIKGLEPLAEEATLESAGVAPGAWLVALPSSTPPPAPQGGAATAVPWTANRLRTLLVEAGAPIDENLVRRVIGNRALQTTLSFCSTAADVAQFCETLGAEPQSETRATVLNETGVCIDGDIYVQHRTTALFKWAFDGGVPCVLKIPQGRLPAAQRECLLYSELGSAARASGIGLVPVRLLTLRGAHYAGLGEGRDTTPLHAGILMPSYPLTLAQAPTQVVLRQGTQVLGRLEQALGFLAAHGWVHGDVKPSNVFLSGDTGDAWLGDFGSSVRVTDAQKRFQGGTPSFQVQGVAVDAPGGAFDCAGMVVTMLGAAGMLEAGSRDDLAWPREVIQAAIARLAEVNGGRDLAAALQGVLQRIPPFLRGGGGEGGGTAPLF